MTEAVNSGALVRSSNGQVSNQAQDAAPAHNNENQENVQQAAPQPQPAFSYWSVFKGLLFRAAIIYFMTSWFRGQPANQNAGGGTSPPGATPASSNLYPNGTVMDMYMYISEDSTFKSFDEPEALVWKEPGLVYGDWYGGPNGDSVYTKNMRFRPSERVKNNGTIFLHVFFVLNGYSPDPKAEKDYSQTHTVYRKKQLNKYKKLRYKRTQNLLTGETAATPEMVEKAEAMKEEILSHWHPNLTVNIIVDHTPWTQGQVPMPVDQYVEFEPTTGKYYPIVYINDYWNLIRDYQAINETTEWLDLQLTFQPLSMFRWQLYVAQGMRSFSFFGQDLMEESEEDKDSLKEAFLETSPYLLAVTVVVSLLHSVFEFLAFKSDIQFWRNRKSLEGLSVRSGVLQCVPVRCGAPLHPGQRHQHSGAALGVCRPAHRHLENPQGGEHYCGQRKQAFWSVPSDSHGRQVHLRRIVNTGIRHDGVQVPVLGAVSPVGGLLRLFAHVPRAQELVLLGARCHVWLPAYIWLHYDDTTVVHQLQAQVSGPLAVAHADVQVSQHFHRRHIRLRHQDAHHVSARLLQRRHCVPNIPVPTLDLPRGSDESQRVWDKCGGRRHAGGGSRCGAAQWSASNGGSGRRLHVRKARRTEKERVIPPSVTAS
ncbi:hypothetical protein MRX96_017636 [Rhipicephalus microplus]